MFSRSRFCFVFFCSALVFFGLFGFSFVPPQLLLWVYYLTRLMALLALLFVPLASLFIPFVLLFGCWLALLVASWFLSLLVSSYVIAIWFLLLLLSSFCCRFFLLLHNSFCCVVWLFFSIAWLFLLLFNIVRTQIEIEKIFFNQHINKKNLMSLTNIQFREVNICKQELT